MTTPSREAQIRERLILVNSGCIESDQFITAVNSLFREDIPWLLDQLASARAEGAAEASKRLVRLQQDVAHVLDEPVFARHVKLLQAALDRSRDERSGRRTATA